MTKKDYIKIAAVLAAEYATTQSLTLSDTVARAETVEHVAAALANMLKADNPNFDVARFLAAASVPSKGTN